MGYTLDDLMFSVEFYRGQWIARHKLQGDQIASTEEQLAAITYWAGAGRCKYMAEDGEVESHAS